MTQKLVAVTLVLASVCAFGCAGGGLPRHEAPTPTPTPPPGQLELTWASRICGFAPGFATLADAWDASLDAEPFAGFEVLRDELLFMASFDLSVATSSASQYLGLLSSATKSSTWHGNAEYRAPAGVVEYEEALFDLFLDFEAVLNYAEEGLRAAESLDDLETVHASVTTAQRELATSARLAAATLSADVQRAMASVDACMYLRPT